MPRSQGTSRKGKPGKNERKIGLGNALKRAHHGNGVQNRNKSGGGGMALQQQPLDAIGIKPIDEHMTKSVLEVQEIDDFLMQADLANREFVSERGGLVVLDETGHPVQQQPTKTIRWDDGDDDEKDATKKNDFAFHELSVPRRPAWDQDTTPRELEEMEKQAFLDWRRSIAAKEEALRSSTNHTTNNTISVTPFEKNLNVWRQLWRVLERSSCLLQIVDARNPLFYLSDDLREYANKPMMVLVNKSDFLSAKQRQQWFDYLVGKGWDVAFFSAALEQEKLDQAAREERRRQEQVELATYSDHDGDDIKAKPPQRHERSHDEADDSDSITSSDPEQQTDEAANAEGESAESLDTSHDTSEEKVRNDTDSGGHSVVPPVLTRDELIDTMLAFARKHDCEPDPRYQDRIQFGMVGFPNVGKSSVINVLVGSSKHTHGMVRVGVASQPGKTKHFQTLLLPSNDAIMLCDCPGLVFPSFVSNTADLIAAGVFPIAQMRDHWPVMSLICQRIPREIINAQYGIHLTPPTEQELRDRGLSHYELHTGTPPPPTPQEFLTAYCEARSMITASSGILDFFRAARIVIKDYADGKLLYCHAPPSSDLTDFSRETIGTALRNTKKLREKLLRQQQQHAHAVVELASGEQKHAEASTPALDDDLLMDMLVSDSSIPAAGNSSQLQHHSNGHKKWGKKGRKNRNKDPYGCYSKTPDDMFTEAASTGLVVNAGKKHGKQGYTRATSYGGVRSALAS